MQSINVPSSASVLLSVKELSMTLFGDESFSLYIEYIIVIFDVAHGVSRLLFLLIEHCRPRT